MTFDEKIMNITRQTSQITKEVRRIDNNKSVTKKV